MPATLAVPTCVSTWHHDEAADASLAALLVAVQEFDREWSALGNTLAQTVAHRVVALANGPFPVARTSGRDVEVDHQPSKVIELRMWDIDEGEPSSGIPAVQQGKTRADVPKSQGQVDDIPLLLDHRMATHHLCRVLIAPKDLVGRVLGKGGQEQWTHVREQRLLGDTRRAV